MKISKDTNPMAEQLASEHEAWVATDFEPDDSPLLEPYDWGDAQPETLGEPLSYVEREGWVSSEPSKKQVAKDG